MPTTLTSDDTLTTEDPVASAGTVGLVDGPDAGAVTPGAATRSPSGVSEYSNWSGTGRRSLRTVTAGAPVSRWR